MAQLALATTGAIIGGATGLPYGVQIGWTIGSLLGSSMGPSTQGPRLADLTVQISSYGAPVPKIWGMMGVAGNIVWAADLIETRSEQGGKGGPSYTSSSYAASFAVAIAEGELQGIRRIWLNSKLVYDVRENASQETAAASQDFSQYFVFYRGTEDQLPDPTIESYEGAGNVEAMRGTAYLVFTNLPLGNYANTPPQVHVETISEEPDVATTTDLQPLEIRAWEMGTSDGGYVHARHSGGGRTLFTAYDPVDGSIVLASGEDYDAVVASVLALGYSTYCGMATGTQFQLDTFGQGTDLLAGLGPVQVWMNYFTQNIEVFLWTGPNDNAVGNTAVCIYGQDPLNPSDILISNIQTSYDDTGHPMSGVLTVLPQGETRSGYNTIAANCPFQYPPNFPPGYYPTAWIGHFASISAKRLPSVPIATCMPGDPHDLGIAELPSDPNFCLSASGVLSQNVHYEQVTGSWLQLQAADPDSPGPTSALTLPGYGPVMLASDPRNTMAFWVAAAADAGVGGSYGSSYPVTVTTAAQAVVTTSSAADTTVLLSEIVTDICRTSGLDDLDFDVTELTDVVFGYARTKVMTGRAAIEPLRQAYSFDAVESGAQIIFRKRGSAPVATVTLDDLGAGVDTPTEPIEHHRDQETELPASVVITYPAFIADYEPGTQQARRISAISQQEMGVEMPVVLEDAAAADIAYTLLYDAWVGRNTRKVALPMKWAALEPTDVITLNDGEFSYTVRVGDKSEQAGVNSLECKDSASLIYTDPAGSAGIVSGGGAVIRFVLPVNLMPLDIPIVRDIDDDGGGYYAAAGSFGNGTYPGTHLYRSADAGANYTFEKDLPAEATIGIADTAIGDYAGGNTVDESSTVRVTIVSGSVSSITRAQLLAGGNLCVLGDEVMQFQRATLVSTGIYDLTGLLRGRFGTEWAMADHADGEPFTLLTSTTVERIPSTLALLNVPLILKGVAFGSSLDAAYPIDFTNTGRGAMPLSPAHLNIASVADLSYEVTWVRRTRSLTYWTDFVDVPLHEDVEAYDVELVSLGGDIESSQRIVGQTSCTLSASGGITLFVDYPGAFMVQDSDTGLASLTRTPVGQSIYIWSSASALLNAGGLGASERANKLVAVGSDDLYVSTQDGTNPSYVKRFSRASIISSGLLTPVATYTATHVADAYGITYDGTYIWVAENYTGQIVKLNATTLVSAASYSMVARNVEFDSVSGHLFVDSGDRVTEVDPSTGGTVQTFITGFSSSNVYPGNGAIFVLGGSGLYVFDITSGIQLQFYPSTVFNTFSGMVVKTATAMALACPATEEILYLDQTTGDELYRIPVPDVQELAGYSVALDTLFVSRLVGGNIVAYAMAPGAIPSGSVVNVYQISSTVGRGFPATYTFP